jgi:hypothetical protein
MLDLNGDPIQLHRWYWVRRRSENATVHALWITGICAQGRWLNGIREVGHYFGSTAYAPTLYQFLPAVPPEWPEEGKE